MNTPAGVAGATSFGHFELHERLGQGGMGVVYRAYDRKRKGEVALKLLPPHLATDAAFIERFRREAQAAVDLNDPHIVPIHDYDEIDGRLYISMQLVRGRDLAKIIGVEGRLSPDRAVHVVRQAAHALDAAHAANLIHRDVKPSNLLVVEDRDDFTYLVDFGITHVIGRHTVGTSLTSTGATVGTLAYMAPERLLGNDLDGRVDVYSLACVLFEMLTGQPPFPMTDPPALITAHLHRPPPRVTAHRSDVTQGWDELIAQGMAKEPDYRYGTPHEFAADAQRVLNGQAPTPVTVVPRARSAVRVASPVAAPDTQVAAELPGSGLAGGGGRPGPSRPGSARTRTLQLAALVCVVLVLAVVGTLVFARRGGVLDQPDGRAPSPGASAAVATPSVPDQPLPVTAAPAPQTSGAGDLGLSVPIATVACDGSYAVFVGAAVTPGNYEAETQGYLDRFPGSSYMLAEQNCASLRQRMPNGASIYTVFYGPYAALSEACSVRAKVGGDAFIRRLDDTTPVGEVPSC